MTNTAHTQHAAGELLTVVEVAAALRVSEMTVRRQIASGALAAVRVGKQWRVSRSALDAVHALRR